MACFSNTTPMPETLDEMISAVGLDRQLYLVGTVNPDGFQDAANTNLVAATDSHENVHYVDWLAVLDGRLGEFLWADATHLRPEGARAYVEHGRACCRPGHRGRRRNRNRAGMRMMPS